MKPKTNAEAKIYSKRYFLCTTISTGYLSGWILNLGVVPLLRLSAFLFFPEFVFLRLLLFCVTRVLETMSLLLNQQALIGHFAFCKPKVLSLNERSVKAIVLSLLSFSLCAASSPLKQSPISLEVGDHYELKLPNMTRFTVGQSDYLSHKEQVEKKSLLLKGLRPGKTQIMVWDTEGQTRAYNVYVYEDSRQIQLQKLKNKLAIAGVKILAGPYFLEIQGEVEELKHYLYLKSFIDKNQQLIRNKLSISKELSDRVFAYIYKRFFGEFVDDISCEVRKFDFVCTYGQNKNISSKLISTLKDKFAVEFIENKNKERMQNYNIRLKLVQMEQMDGREVNLGLSQLNTRLKDLFQTGLRSVIENNELILKENNIRLSSLAEPEAIVRSGKEVSLDIGSDIPYTTTSIQGASETQWKFAGLEIRVKIEKRGNALEVSYSTSFTRPSQGQTISGNRESSTVMLPLNIPLEVFQVSFKTIGQKKQNIPILGDIPILGKIFTSTGAQSNYKNITGVIQIEKHRH